MRDLRRISGKGFPRIRGDRPWAVYCARSADEVSPAYAGIDPSKRLGETSTGCFPRIRGDRPAYAGMMRNAGWFPPHTRGSTRPDMPPRARQAVSPAYAGIDRATWQRSINGACFPRIRGDRPRGAVPALGEHAFPPHTRGSTCRAHRDPCYDRVSPAYAGIDPRYRPARRCTRGFPRIRGDRPGGAVQYEVMSKFPPHTRGSTGSRNCRRTFRPVSPAYAGIDPVVHDDPFVLACFPRIRGDRPRCPPGSPARAPFPPHTRGSTGGLSRTSIRLLVSPAYAGIDRLPGVREGRAVRFPRIRGDRP